MMMFRSCWNRINDVNVHQNWKPHIIHMCISNDTQLTHIATLAFDIKFYRVKWLNLSQFKIWFELLNHRLCNQSISISNQLFLNLYLWNKKIAKFPMVMSLWAKIICFFLPLRISPPFKPEKKRIMCITYKYIFRSYTYKHTLYSMLFSEKTQFGRLPNKRSRKCFDFILYGAGIKNKSQSSREK